MSLLHKVPWVPKCLSALVPKCLNALSVWVSKYLKCPSARVPSECPSALWVLSKRPSAWVLSKYLKCLSAFWVSLNGCPVPECLIRCDLNKILNVRRYFMYIQNEKKMVEKNLRSLILKQYQSANLKSFLNWFEMSYFCKILLFVWPPL